MNIKQRKMMLPKWLTWKRFIWYLLFVILMQIFLALYYYGVHIAAQKGQWSQNQAKIYTWIMYVVSIGLWIYPIVWRVKRKKFLYKSN